MTTKEEAEHIGVSQHTGFRMDALESLLRNGVFLYITEDSKEIIEPERARQCLMVLISVLADTIAQATGGNVDNAEKVIHEWVLLSLINGVNERCEVHQQRTKAN